MKTRPTATGSVLLAVLCLVAMLSLLIVSAVSLTNQHGEMQAAHQGMMRARQLAEMGVAVAAHPLVGPGDPLLKRQVSNIESYEVRVSVEEGRLNLNALLTETRLPLLVRVFASWGMSPADAEVVAATLMDWTDADDLKRRPDSAEKFEYESMGFPDRPRNQMLASIDELELILGTEKIPTSNPEWRSYFTLRGTGLLDVNAANAQVIAAVTGASEENVRRLVDGRNGPDGLPSTGDDVPIRNIEVMLAALGIDAQENSVLREMLTLRGDTLHIESTGAAGDFHWGIDVVMRRDENHPEIVEWRAVPSFSGGQNL